MIVVTKIRDLNLTGTPWATSACCGMTFTFTNISPIMIINRIYEHQNVQTLQLVSFLVGPRTYQHPCTFTDTVTLFVSEHFRTCVSSSENCFPNTRESYRNLPKFSEHTRKLPKFTEVFRTHAEVTEIYRSFPNTRESYRNLPKFLFSR